MREGKGFLPPLSYGRRNTRKCSQEKRTAPVKTPALGASGKWLLVIGILWLAATRAVAQSNMSLSPQAQTLFLAETSDLKRGNFQGAANSFERFITLDNRFGPTYLNLGLAYHSQGQYPKAIAAFKRALQIDNNLESAALFLGIDYYKTGSSGEASKPLKRALMLKADDADAHLWLGRALLQAGDYEEAVPQLQSASKAHREDVSVLYDLARAHLLLSQHIFNEIYRRDPHSYWAYFLMGQAYKVEGKDDLAAPEFKRALQLNSHLEGAHGALGEIHLAKGDFAGAEREFEDELQISPYNYPVTCELADILIQTGKADEAVPFLKKTLTVKPRLGCARYELGRVWFRSGHFRKAAELRHIQENVMQPEPAPGQPAPEN